ncbi:MAG: hypothetical protein V4642_08055 [Bacteroidota bacterium]
MVEITTEVHTVSTEQKEAILLEITKTKVSLLKALSAFKNEQMNVVPFDGGWTAAQTADHLLKAGSVITFLEGNMEETHRPADEKVPEIKAMFLDSLSLCS